MEAVKVGISPGKDCWVRFDDRAYGLHIDHSGHALAIHMPPGQAESLLEQLADKLGYYPPEPRSNSGRRAE